jgi:hypothetical protein
MKKNKQNIKKSIINQRHKIIIKIGEALKKMKKDKLPESPFQKELKKYPLNYWLVEGDMPNKDGSPQMFIIEDTQENSRMLSGHSPVDLNDYGIEV